MTFQHPSQKTARLSAPFSGSVSGGARIEMGCRVLRRGRGAGRRRSHTRLLPPRLRPIFASTRMIGSLCSLASVTSSSALPPCTSASRRLEHAACVGTSAIGDDDVVRLWWSVLVWCSVHSGRALLDARRRLIGG
eukprot:2588561-Rhodomonas_salina.3